MNCEAPIDWPPKVPPKFPLTVYKDGWCKTIGGKWRHICGKLAPMRAKEKYEEGMRAGKWGKRPVVPLGAASLTVKQLANLYGAWLQLRMTPGHRRKLDPRTYHDYAKSIQLFLDTPADENRIADLRVEELTPDDFNAYLSRIPGKSPNTRSRYVAAVKAMFKWAGPEKEGKIKSLPAYGADFAKATKDELREARADLTKSFTHDEMRALLQRAMHTRIWWPLILLALNGAFSNVELARLRRDQIDLDRGTVCSVRGKKGRAYRKVMLWPITITVLRQYERPAPAMPTLENLFFLTGNGLPYSRAAVSRNAAGAVTEAKRQDTLAVDFGKLLTLVGLPRDGRSFSGMRTTFRTEAEGMISPRDDDAIDLIMGHPRKHISAEYVERFPEHRLTAITDYIFNALFNGWAYDPVADLPKRTVQPWAGRPNEHGPSPRDLPKRKYRPRRKWVGGVLTSVETSATAPLHSA
jgi:integrase